MDATTTVALAPAPPPERHDARLAGDLAIWIFILAELLAFGVFFAAYAFARANDPALFAAEQLALNRSAGAINTVLLLTASYFVVRAVHAAEAGRGHRGARWLLAALGCAAGFVAIKLAEYAAAFEAGISLSSSTFHMFYLSLTFFHFMHVLLGMVILGALWVNARRGRYDADNMNGIESGAAYWHMVDLVWLVLFPLVYVIR
ncbi:cytochrome c oxidase subunit 3 family protein [Pseudothauera rhizosphaerae]|uniref:Cytochrome c oxidase subunit 3 family protein n=1 Tax=Pseudothauera rhizosphaerae TaxID=2565932 RepID=A0A4S4AEN6_9RHOO|nr:cytochrome c oxidase subunit 3 family protein [Pseudothauera rhizosphaerae]THF57211.1 cytochrome c oxidase subunit 3 family protein [Pseudothauera rhizosphaerae]